VSQIKVFRGFLWFGRHGGGSVAISVTGDHTVVCSKRFRVKHVVRDGLRNVILGRVWGG